MLKPANVNDLKSMNDRKVFYGMQQVVEDSGEGRFFLCRLERGSIEKSCPGTTGKRVGYCGFFT
jgi:hypothetical protein